MNIIRCLKWICVPKNNRILMINESSDEEWLSIIALKNKDSNFRSIAVNKLTNQIILTKVANEDSDWFVRSRAISKITDQNILNAIALNINNCNREKAIGMLTDQTILSIIAIEDKDESIRQKAVLNLTNQTILTKIALEDSSIYVKSAAASRVTDHSSLLKIAMISQDENVIKNIMKRITNKDNFVEIFKNTKSEYAKWCACELLNKDHKWDGNSCKCNVCGYVGKHIWRFDRREDHDQWTWTNYYVCERCGKTAQCDQRYESGADNCYPRMQNKLYYLE